MSALDAETRAVLRQSGPLSGLDDAALDRLEGRVERVALGPGETLMRRGETGSEIFLLLRGRLAVLAEERGGDRPVQELGPGTWLGEVAAIAGGERTATVRALEDCELLRLSRAELLRALEERPEALARLLQEVRIRWSGIRFRLIVQQLFGELDDQTLDELMDEVEWVSLCGGERLFEQGQPGDSAYLVLSGRLQVVQDHASGGRVLNEVGRGETLGEMALLTRETRSASVFAIRDSQLARLSDATFEKLIERHPLVLRRIAAQLVERLRRRDTERSSRRSVSGFCLVSAGGAPEQTAAFARRLVAALSAHGPTLTVDREGLEAKLGRPGITDLRRDDPASLRLEHWLDESEASHRYVVYLADPDWSGWTERAVGLADHLILVASSSGDPRTGEIEAALASRPRAVGGRQTSLILLHSGTSEPTHTSRWLQSRHLDQHFHVCLDDWQDVERVARTLTGRAVGLVLGGGGARGFAHLGVLRALDEVGVPVDVVGGTSMGAIIAAARALGFGWQEARDRLRQHLRSLYDPTLPIVSLLAGRRIRKQLTQAFGERDIEDLPLPFFCVSTNISRATERIHRRGSLVGAIRASISLPGVLPPVQQDGDLLVDGGVVNNLPADVVGRIWGCGRVIAVDVSPDTDFQLLGSSPSEVSGWSLLWRRLRRSKSEEVPHIASILMRSSVIPSIIADRQRQGMGDQDLRLQIPTADWRLLDFESVEPICQRGYESAIGALQDWWVKGLD